MVELLKKLAKGPKLLFLGQSYLRLDSGEDILLKQIVKKYGEATASDTSYRSIFSTSAYSNKQEALSWIHSRCMYVPVPESTQTVCKLGWNGIITSGIDNLIESTCRSDRRDVQPIFSELYIPSDPRNRSRLNIWHLYGGVEAADDVDKPALREEDLWSRETRATVMASRIPEIVTPLGVLCIDGYDIESDWFNTNQLYAIIDALASGQTYLFSTPLSSITSPRLRKLITEGKLKTCEIGLAQYLSQAIETGALAISLHSLDEHLSGQIGIAGKVVSVPSALLRETTGAATLLTESHILPPKVLSKDELYTEFRQFLFESAYTPQWSAFSLGLAFERSFEATLRKFVIRGLSYNDHRQQPIILHGQTGTGKSVALSHLAYIIAKEGTFPVLFIERSTRSIRREALDKFCEWAESTGSEAVLLVWDGMHLPHAYHELLKYLLSRGRKVLLVGSSYTLKREDENTAMLIEAPPGFDTQELTRFTGFLGSLDESLSDLFGKKVQTLSGSFLVLLYRLLPATRAGIRHGIERELSFVEAAITEASLKDRLLTEISTALGEQLLAAGLIKEKPLLDGHKQDMAGEEITELKMLIGLVMVPGQFNLLCPFELLVRAIGKGVSDRFIRILQAVDLFHWGDDVSGNIQIGPRSSLEAELVVQQRLGGAASEIEYAIRLLSNLRAGMMFEDTEIDFAVELLQAIGPNGRKPQYYASNYKDIAECLGNLRTSRGVIQPRLMLQESMFLRESTKPTRENDDERDRRLVKTIEISNQALQLINPDSGNRSLRSYILTEIASTMGSRAKLAKQQEEKIRLATECFYYCFAAHAENSQNIHPIITALWTAKDLLDDGNIEVTSKRAVEEAVWHAISLGESEGFEGDALTQFNSWKMQLYQRLGQIELSESEFQELLKRRSPQGVYLRAVERISFLFYDDNLTSDQRQECSRAYQYLIDYSTQVENSGSYLYLMFRVWWAWKTGGSLHVAERTSLPLSQVDWQSCRQLLSKILGTPEFEQNLRLRFLLAVTAFHLNDFARGFQEFRELDRDSFSYPLRLHKLYYWSGNDGTPRNFTGTVSRVEIRGRCWMQVSEIQQRVPFMSYDTGRKIVKKGDSFGGFRIAFSMIGPIVDFRA